MKKILLTLLVLIIVLVLILGGLVLWTTSTNRRFTVNSLTTTPLTTKSVDLDTVPKNLTLTLRTAKLIIKPGQQNRLTLSNVATNQYVISTTNNQLDVKESNLSSHPFEIGHSPVLILNLTDAHVLRNLTIDQFNGTLKLNDLTTQHLKIHHHNGTTIAHHLTVTAGGTLVKDNGSTTLNQLSSDGLQVAFKTGQVHVNGKKAAHNRHHYTQAGQHPLTITSGSGQVRITN